MTLQQRIRKSGNSYIVTIPRKEMERLGLREGQWVSIELQPLELRPVLSPELRAIAERSLREHADAYRYLAEH